MRRYGSGTCLSNKVKTKALFTIDYIKLILKKYPSHIFNIKFPWTNLIENFRVNIPADTDMSTVHKLMEEYNERFATSNARFTPYTETKG